MGHSIGVIAAVVILLTYYPPSAFRRRWGMASIEETSVRAVDLPGTG